MRARRYTVLVADRTSGVLRRVTLNLRWTVGLVLVVLSLPILVGLGAKWATFAEIDDLRARNSLLQEENGNYRAATGELTTQIQSLEGVINDLGQRSVLDPEQARAMQKLPAVIKIEVIVWSCIFKKQRFLIRKLKITFQHSTPLCML